jgi:hypothetical protein
VQFQTNALSNNLFAQWLHERSGILWKLHHSVLSETSKLFDNITLKGHGNEADFLGFLQKLGPHRSLTLPFEPSPIGFEFAEIFVIEKQLPDSVNRGVSDSPTRRVGESAFECLKEKLGESGSRHGESGSRHGESGSRHGESGSRYSNFLKFCIDFPDFKRLNQPFKDQLDKKEARDVMYYHHWFI